MRLTERLHEVISESSAREGRSINTEILLRLAQTVEDDTTAKARQARMHLGMIEFLANGIEELAGLLTVEQRETDRIKLILDLSRRLSQPGER